MDTNPLEKYYRRLSDQLGNEWEQLATQLGFLKENIDHFKQNNATLADRIFDMLIAWSRNQPRNHENSARILRAALEAIDRRDLADELNCTAFGSFCL